MFGGPGSPTQVMSTLKRRESFSWFDGASGRFQRLRRKMRSHSVDGYDYSLPVSPTSKSGESDALTVNLCFITLQVLLTPAGLFFSHVAFQFAVTYLITLRTTLY